MVVLLVHQQRHHHSISKRDVRSTTTTTGEVVVVALVAAPALRIPITSRINNSDTGGAVSAAFGGDILSRFPLIFFVVLKSLYLKNKTPQSKTR
jgi:hypothetical protein